MENHLRFAKLKPSKVVIIINNLLVDLFVHQTFFRQTLEKSKFAKHSPRQTFLLAIQYALYCKVYPISQVKCVQYWPHAVGQSQTFGPLNVCLTEELEFADYVVRTIELKVL